MALTALVDFLSTFIVVLVVPVPAVSEFCEVKYFTVAKLTPPDTTVQTKQQQISVLKENFGLFFGGFGGVGGV